MVGLVLLDVGVGLMVVINVLVTGFYLGLVQGVSESKEMISRKKYGRVSLTLIILLSTLINHSLYQILNSKLLRFTSITNPSNKRFWMYFKRLTRISIISYLCFVVSGVLLSFKELDKTQYLYFSLI